MLCKDDGRNQNREAITRNNATFFYPADLDGSPVSGLGTSFDQKF
jgi:hypothetical protein